MRLRLILSFIFIVLVSVISVVLIARQNTANEVRTFMFRGGMTGTEGLIEALEEYYQLNQSWLGVDELLSMSGRGQGMGHDRQGMGPGMGQNMGSMLMNQRLLLVDEHRNILVDTTDAAASGRLSESELNQAIPLEVNKKTVGYLLPEGGISFTRNDETKLLQRLNQAAITAGLLSVSLSLLLAFLLAYRLLRPVKELTKAANRLAQGDFSQRVPTTGNDELTILARSFNQMAASLQEAKESRRAMTADIAHELRNPLAVQRANLEALQDGIYPLTPGNLDPVLQQNYLLNRLVEDLRTLALADSGQLTLERIPTDLPTLVRHVVNRHAPQADAQRVTLQMAAPDSCPLISIDPGRVEQILGNLLSNALRFTPEGGQINIEITCHQNHDPNVNRGNVIQVTIHDSGPGIPAEALPHIFDRFFRADQARSRREGGTGLGLSIALQMAQAHGGTLSAQNYPDGGTLFTLTLPLILEDSI